MRCYSTSHSSSRCASTRGHCHDRLMTALLKLVSAAWPPTCSTPLPLEIINSHWAVMLTSGCLQRLLTFSEEQMRDIMHLRRIYVTRRGLHAMERRALLSQAPVSHHQIPLPSDNLTQLSDLASQLKKNAADDYRVYHRIACALRRGVSCSRTCRVVLRMSSFADSSHYQAVALLPMLSVVNFLAAFCCVTHTS